MKHLVVYGNREVITEGGSWYKAALSFWQVEEVITWRIVRGGERSVIEGFFGENEGSTTSIAISPLGSTTSSWMTVFNRACRGPWRSSSTSPKFYPKLLRLENVVLTPNVGSATVATNVGWPDRRFRGIGCPPGETGA